MSDRELILGEMRQLAKNAEVLAACLERVVQDPHAPVSVVVAGLETLAGDVRLLGELGTQALLRRLER